MNNSNLLSLLQLTSPALPVGAYSYSEGLESLVEGHWITNETQLQQWIVASMTTGSIGLEAAILLRAQRTGIAQDFAQLTYWNNWLSASRETAEIQKQNWQMGRSLLKLLGDLYGPTALPILDSEECNFAIAFALAAVLGGIDERTTLLGYLYSWASNIVSAGIKLIPLGQTAGQRLIMDLQGPISENLERIMLLSDDRLYSCSWGLALASMAHETQYSRLFRS
jgi:urease accessory protein